MTDKIGPLEPGDIIGDLVGVLTSTVTFGVDGALVYSTASDIDIILWDLPTITGTPRAIWDESSDAYSFLPNLLTTVLFLSETTTPTAVDSHGAIYTTSDNELFWQDGGGTEHLLHGDAFSTIWFHGVSTVPVVIAAQNALTKIDSFTVVGHEDDLANVVGSVSTNDLTLSAIGGGEYEISFHGSVTATGGADKKMLVAVGIILATPKDITDVTDNTVSPIVITSIAHGLENGDMVEIVDVVGNTAAKGS
ncbi:hypothetical protein LCGC14_2250370, partial [marine sediment metagenome]